MSKNVSQIKSILLIFVALLLSCFMTRPWISFYGHENVARRVRSSYILTPEQFLEKYRGKNIPMVIGGTGFIGSNVVDSLLKDGQEVAAFIRSIDEESLENVRHNLGKDRFAAINMSDLLDQRNVTNLEEIIKQAPVIYHIAFSGVTMHKDFSEVVDSFTVNSLLTSVITELAKKHNRKIVFISTASIYNSAIDKTTPVSEEMPLPFSKGGISKEWIKRTAKVFKDYAIGFAEEKRLANPYEFVRDYIKDSLGTTEVNAINRLFPESIYVISKVLAEEFVKQMPAGLSIILRMPYVFGPRIRESQTLYKLIEEILRNKQPSVYDIKMNWLYVEDAAEAIVEAGKKTFSNNEIFIVGSDYGSISRVDIGKMIMNLVSEYNAGPPKIVLPDMDFSMPPLNISKALRELFNSGFKFVPLEDALSRTIKWIRENAFK